jgi:hypothetical protein
MYIKEDIILPQTVSFYDLIVNRAQGKSGPLFQFDVAEHAAMTFDPRMKSKDTHAGKNRKGRKEGRKICGERPWLHACGIWPRRRRRRRPSWLSGLLCTLRWTGPALPRPLAE